MTYPDPIETEVAAVIEARGTEWDAPAWWCNECGHAEYIGTPDDYCTRCGERNQT